MKDGFRWIIMGMLSVCYAGVFVALIMRVSKIKINWKEQLDKLRDASIQQLKSNQKWYDNRKVYLSVITKCKDKIFQVHQSDIFN